MFGLLVKLAVLIGVLGGGTYALVKTLMRRNNDLEDLASAQRDLVLLKESYDNDEMTKSEYEARTAEVMAWAEERNLPPLLAAEISEISNTPEGEAS